MEHRNFDCEYVCCAIFLKVLLSLRSAKRPFVNCRLGLSASFGGKCNCVSEWKSPLATRRNGCEKRTAPPPSRGSHIALLLLKCARNGIKQSKCILKLMGNISILDHGCFDLYRIYGIYHFTIFTSACCGDRWAKYRIDISHAECNNCNLSLLLGILSCVLWYSTR